MQDVDERDETYLAALDAVMARFETEEEMAAFGSRIAMDMRRYEINEETHRALKEAYRSRLAALRSKVKEA